MIFALLCAALVVRSDAAKILTVSFLNTSHFAQLDGVARPLIARNHTLYALLDEELTLPKNSPYTVITHRSVGSSKMAFLSGDAAAQLNFFEQSRGGEEFQQLARLLKDLCVSIMSDESLFVKLSSLKLDLVLVDNFFAPCFALVPHKLGVPFVTVGTLVRAGDLRLPYMVSVLQPGVGLDKFGVAFCEETSAQLSFVRRFCRLAVFGLMEFMAGTFEEDYLHEYADFSTTEQVRRNSMLALVNANYLLAGPLPKLPHVEYVGGLTTRAAKPLEPNLERWMSEAPNVVITSFGSNFRSLPPPIAVKLFEAFGRLPSYRFLFRFDKQDTAGLTVPSNVRLMDWLPQNDVLGHNSTRLFITHSGNNGQQEALYHGVPMMCFYIHSDQKSNAQRAVKLGFAKMVGILEFTADQLVADLNELLTSNVYYDNIKKASAAFHSEKHPSERAADAVEHVLKYGGAHLRPTEAYELTWWQFYMLDVLAVIYTVITAVLYGLFKLACWLLRFAFQRADSKKKPKSD